MHNPDLCKILIIITVVIFFTCITIFVIFKFYCLICICGLVSFNREKNVFVWVVGQFGIQNLKKKIQDFSPSYLSVYPLWGEGRRRCFTKNELGVRTPTCVSGDGLHSRSMMNCNLCKPSLTKKLFSRCHKESNSHSDRMLYT